MVSSRLADWQKVTFDDAFSDITAKATKVDQSEFLHSGKFAIVDQGQNFIAGYTDNEELVWGDDLPVIIFGDHTRTLKYVDFPFVLGADGTKVLKPNKDILPLFAYYQLLSFDIPSAGYSRHFKFLKDFTFRYPSLSEQKRIASLLARADRLRQLRRAAHELGDSLLQSVFLEMFGEALNGRNPEIPLVPLETLCTKITDGTHVTPTYLNDGVPFLSVKNITRFPGMLDFSDIKYISPEEHKKISKLANVERDDILYTKVGATYGYAQIVDTDREFSIFVSVALLKPNKSKVLPKYLECVMKTRFVKEQADRLVSGIGVPDLHLREIKTFQIPLPPMSQQEEFAGVVARVEALRGRMSEAGRQVEGLFESLLAEAFQ
jgi:type I restriction enzyme, S subunit